MSKIDGTGNRFLTARSDEPARFDVIQNQSASAVRLRLHGDWTIDTSADLEDRLAAALPPNQSADIVIDGADLGRFDTAGAWLVEKMRRIVEARGGKSHLQGFSSAQMTLLIAVDRTGRRTVEPERRPSPVQRLLIGIGKAAAEIVSDAAAALAILGEFIVSFLGIITWRRPMRWAPFVNHIERTCLHAVPIIALMSFLIGMIIAQQGAFYFSRYGAELFVVDFVGVLVCREIGVLLTAIMVAGRSGSAFTAEIGSMKMREEIDALTVLGVSPTDVLVVPRMLALIISVPILALIADLAALAGSWLIVVYYIGIPSNTYFIRLQEALQVSYVVVGIAKAPAMAILIGLLACVEGLKVGGSAESLGRHTTASVVKAIFMVIVIDGIFAMFFTSLGI